jgi:hypothetical protein
MDSMARRIRDLDATDLSAVTEAGTVFRRLDWVPIDLTDPAAGETVRELHTATPIPKCEGTWWVTGSSGSCRRTAAGRTPRTRRIAAPPPMADRSGRTTRTGGHCAWSCASSSPTTSRGPDNITVSPHGYAVMCTDGDDDANQFLAGITPQGQTFPLAHNRMSDEEFAGATFSPTVGRSS